MQATAVGTRTEVAESKVRELMGRRCDADRHGVEKAYYFAEIYGADLAFCVHHANKFEVKLMQDGAKVIDLRYLIDE
jgi:hypothetical protein